MKKTQYSNNNPGWQGKGIPSLKKLTIYQIRPLSRLLVQWKFSEFINTLKSLFANIVNFHIKIWQSEEVECPCCGWKGLAFIATANWRSVAFQSKCPQCDSRSRHRGLFFILPEVIKQVPLGEFLFFAPEKILLDYLKTISGIPVITTDYNSIDVDFSNQDIQKLSFPDNSFAMIICNHVLEHVEDDKSAMKECFRILVSKGIALFTIPGEFSEYNTTYFKKPDNNGHYRHYGMDIIEKLSSSFDEVLVIDMSKNIDSKWNIREGDCVFICKKI